MRFLKICLPLINLSGLVLPAGAEELSGLYQGTLKSVKNIGGGKGALPIERQGSKVTLLKIGRRNEYCQL